ncbi:MAG: alpha/beta fold hydrolase, partial [Bacillota bacterium]|nr:alpha/beta fold hydrolase [Bacillota bacterium]
MKSNFVTINGYKILYLEAGTKEPVILLMHGIPTNTYIWRNVIPRLSSAARVIAIDMIGFGKSDKPVDIE